MFARVCLGFVTVICLACGSSGAATSTPTTPTTPSTPSTPTTPEAPAPKTATILVPAADYASGKTTTNFDPGALTVDVGTTVAWTNNDLAAHNTTGDGGAWSGGLAPGATYTRVFNTVGTFNYQCNIHPAMSGSIVVK
jgi:plastocyanin